MAWAVVTDLYWDLENAEVDQWDDSGEVTEEYWQAAQQPISVALALAQQGIELLLKGRIAGVSPFLLLTGSPRDWPSGCTTKHVAFADFRTIEAHELIKAHDSIIRDRLSDSFKEQFERARRLRNVIFHGVDKNARPTGIDVFRLILEAVETLIGPRSWIKTRRSYLQTSPPSIAYSEDQGDVALVNEFLKLNELLTPQEMRRFFGHDKKKRSYICYSCATSISDYAEAPKIATLRSRSPHETLIYCPVCDAEREVIRRKCTKPGCVGNVLDAEDEVCLTCYR